MTDFLINQNLLLLNTGTTATKTASASSLSLNSYIECETADQNSTTALTTTTTTTTQLNDDEQNLFILRIKYLEEELKNAQADKEFVWSLWRQLQTSNPDLSSAIAFAVQREKERGEQKDKKVLEILQIKDENIEKLTNLCSGKDSEIKTLEAKLFKSDDELKCAMLNLKTLQDKELMYEQIVRTRDEKLNHFLRENENLANKLSEYAKENDFLKQSEQQAQQSISLLNNENQKLSDEVRCLRKSEENLRRESKDLLNRLNTKLEFINEQEKCIKQLRTLHLDLQNAVRTEKDTHSVLEKENESLKLMYEDLNRKYLESIQTGDKVLKENYSLKLEFKRLKFKEKCFSDLIQQHQNEIKDLKSKCEQFKLKIEYLKKEKKKVQFTIEEANEKSNKVSVSSSVRENSTQIDSSCNNHHSSLILKLNKDLFRLKDENFRLKREIRNLNAKLSKFGNHNSSRKKLTIFAKNKAKKPAPQHQNVEETVEENRIEKLERDSLVKYIQLCEKLAEEYRILHLKFIRLKKVEIKLKKLSSKKNKNAKKKIVPKTDDQSSSYIKINDALKRQLDELKAQHDSLNESKSKLDLRIKSLTFDLSKQLNAHKMLKQENESLSKNLKSSEEKCSNLERDTKNKRQLIESYKTKIQELTDQLTKLPNESESKLLNDLNCNIKALQNSVQEFKRKIKDLENEKSAFDAQLNEKDNLLAEMGSKYDFLLKEKSSLEANIKKLRQKNIDLEKMSKNLEQVAENNIKSLSKFSQETLDMASSKIDRLNQIRLLYESLFKELYETMLRRSIKHSKKKREQQEREGKEAAAAAVALKEQKEHSENENIKEAINLASSLLNLNSNDLNDILSISDNARLIQKKDSSVLSTKQLKNRLVELENHFRTISNTVELSTNNQPDFAPHYSNILTQFVNLFDECK